jgi:hypothetical protein
MLDSYINDKEISESDFKDIAEIYFNNYLTEWCDINHLDDQLRKRIVNVLTDYSAFFFDSIIHDLNDPTQVNDDLKN